MKGNTMRPRILVEISETSSNEITDTYIIENVRDTYAAKNEEIQALRGFFKHPSGAVELGRAFRKFFAQLDRGLLGYGDEMLHIVEATNGKVKYFFTVLEDGGKHSRRTWQNTYAFGPIHKDDESKPWIPEECWVNAVNMSE
jgi:hypothetical protein